MRLNTVTVDDADLQEKGTGESGLRGMMWECPLMKKGMVT
jgi:hypothetical protein